MGAASWGTDRLDLVARGASSIKLFHRVQNGNTWENWREIGSRFLSGPAVSTWGPNRLDVFAKSWDHNLLHRFCNGQAWSEWLDLGVIGTDDAPAAVSRKRGNIELFVRDEATGSAPVPTPPTPANSTATTASATLPDTAPDRKEAAPAGLGC
ncbi:hypothetical protein [Streptomyces sp. NRRL S-340]|uniref:hypothetical protein n=1 Tax=Streptomyces sp. NRRL S-340 TaxID=1463901 RepID=UPI00131BA430|nr:hypothetical protein [Streptomyces sp. NRRL S-340]